MTPRGICFLLCISALFPTVLPAQSEETENIAILLALSPGDGASGAIGTFLERAALLEFRRLGFPAVSVDLDAGGAGIEDRLLARAKTSAIPYGCIVFYSVEDDTLRVSMELRGYPDNPVLAEQSFSRSLSLSVDRAVAENINALVREAGITPPERVVPDDATPEVDTGERPAEEESREVREDRVEEKKRLFETALWFGPFLPNGASAEVIPYGLFSEITADFRIPLRSGHLGLGVHSGFQYFPAEGVLIDAAVFLIPLGIDVRYILGGEGRVTLFIGSSGGAALMLVQTQVQDTVVTVFPYAQVTLGAGIAIRPWFGFGLKVSYAVYFESGGPIFGFLPSLGIYFKP